MKIIHQKLIVLFFVFLTFGFQCDDGELFQVENNFEFELPFEVFPVQKEYKINDTIQIFTRIENNSLKDLNSNEQIEIECIDLPIRFYVGVRYFNINEFDSEPLFELVIEATNFQVYSVENNGQASNFVANISEDLFDKETIKIINIIPKRTGIFMMNLFQFGDIYMNRAEDCSSTDPIYDLVNMTHLFDVDDSNPELLEESPLPSNVILSEDSHIRLTEEKRIFWFKVVE